MERPVSEITPLLLDIYRDGVLLRTRRFTSSQVITIGSGATATLVLPEEPLADVQVIVHRDELGLYQLVELLSTDSRVNGQAGHRAWLPDGSRIQIGDTHIRFWHSEAHRPDPGPALEDAAASSASEAEAAPVEAPVEAPQPAAHTSAVPTSASSDVADAAPGDAVYSSRGEVVFPEFLSRAESSSDMGLDRRSPDVLEVAAAWGDLVLDVKHFAPGTEAVTVGAATGHRLRLLGRPVGWVPPVVSKLAWLTGPGITEVTEEPRAEFYVPGDALTESTWPLFRWDDDAFELVFREDWDGVIEGDDEARSLAELVNDDAGRREAPGVRAVRLEPGQRVVIEVGGVTLAARMTAPGKRVVAGMAEQLDRPFAGTLASTAFMGAMLAMVIGSTQPQTRADISGIPDRFVQVILEEPRAERSPAPVITPAANPEAGEGAAAKRKEGKRGQEDAAPNSRGDQAALDQQAQDRDVANSSGLLGALSELGALSDVMDSSGLGSNLRSGLDSLVGSLGPAIGTGGLGSRCDGDGPCIGGGGTVDGIGGVGTSGRGGGLDGYGSEYGVNGEKAVGGVVSSAPPILLGNLDRSEVDKVIKRHLSAIRHCYQKELPRNPDLGGKVVIKFVIGTDGNVSSASTKASSLANPTVEACINQRFMTFDFPKPRGNGIVLVSYPFFFAPG